ncbi:hypothetical protein GJ689_07775 [Rhodoplanes serenus]|uniref:Uncharacterized protein n=1 Tax=Rhodoplanes serenus TaxID=200615 RepID=A0A9X4XJ61_9BRAD|nr:hypothetical protein [Rhodoplanes serenus]MTW16105.1 hypothetical protein [Rhodoplanes serenus]
MVEVQTSEAAVLDSVDHPENEELVSYQVVCDMEEPLNDIADFAAALTMLASDLQEPASGAVCRIGRTIGALAEGLKKQHEALFRMLGASKAEDESDTNE